MASQIKKICQSCKKELNKNSMNIYCNNICKNKYILKRKMLRNNQKLSLKEVREITKDTNNTSKENKK